MLTQQHHNKLKITFGGFSCAGKKSQNQDAFSALQPEGTMRQLKGVVACVADGVSCSENAQQASQIAVSQFIDDYFATPDTWSVRTAASKILSALNNWLFHHSQLQPLHHNNFVTTFTSLVIKSNTVHLFHVGDSRIYRYRGNTENLQLLTRDHTQRAGKRSLLTRALGMDNHLKIDYQQKQLASGDIFILTSDGVHEYVTPAEIYQAITADQDLEHVARTLVEHGLHSGSNDNLTCLLVRVDELPQATFDEVYRELTKLAIPPVLDIGMKIDNYEVKRIIHSGTRSHLYLVQHPNHNQPYVLKAPSKNFTDDVQYLEGFIREQWIGLRINSDSVMKTYPPDHNSKFLYLLAEYIQGQTLRQWMHDNPVVSLEKMREMAQGIITAMRVFKRMEMVHRDLKPENIMVCEDGLIKIIDFGTVKVNGLSEIASLITEDIPVGSVNYIAPEYLLQNDNSNSGGHYSDLFSLGVIVYEMLSGKLPFNMSHVHRRRPKNIDEWHYHSLQQHRKDIPPWIDGALKKATHPQYQQRYEVLSEFMQDLCKPNIDLMEKYRNAPLIERNPVVIWQAISLILFIIILIQIISFKN